MNRRPDGLNFSRGNITLIALLFVVFALWDVPAFAQESSAVPPPNPPRPLPSPDVTSADPNVVTVPEPATGRIRPKAPYPGPQYVVTSLDLNRSHKGGTYVGVFGGMSLLQDEFFEEDGINLAATGRLGWSGDGVTPMAGIKVGYLWPFDTEPIDQFDAELGKPSIRLSGALEFEAYYLNNEIEATFPAPISGADTFILDSAVFAVNAFLVGQVKNWRFYVGPGIGVAWINISDYDFGPDSVAGLEDEDDQVALAFQAIAGAEYLFDRGDWALFSEARYLGLSEADFFSGAAAIEIEQLDQILLNVGVKKYF
ncbi:MAG: hypothetical protein AAGA18_01970 [Verrucomicrobiota bacterium]